MTEQLVVTNVNQFLTLARKKPGILNIGGFAFLRKFLDEPSCGKCNKKGNVLNELRPQWEASFAVLSASEKNQIKSILDTKKMCYYFRQPNGQLKSSCF